ncbi:MAG: hypothetical protein ACD_37C00600G0002 [uncultured bacterium]|nr:MAG: hypothetical protein ACD_37C00600G0002 [uncultured bacterium]
MKNKISKIINNLEKQIKINSSSQNSKNFEGGKAS